MTVHTVRTVASARSRVRAIFYYRTQDIDCETPNKLLRRKKRETVLHRTSSFHTVRSGFCENVTERSGVVLRLLNVPRCGAVIYENVTVPSGAVFNFQKCLGAERFVHRSAPSLREKNAP